MVELLLLWNMKGLTYIPFSFRVTILFIAFIPHPIKEGKVATPKAPPKPEWMGTIQVGPFKFDARGYSSSGKADVPVIYKVHVTCKNPLPAPEVKTDSASETSASQTPKEDSKNTDTKSRGKGKKDAQVTDQTSEENTPESTPTLAIAKLICPACHIEIPTNEIGDAIIAQGVIVLLTEADKESLRFEKTKLASGVYTSDAGLEMIGSSRRFYLFPSGIESLRTYWDLYKVLDATKLVAFFPTFVLKDTPLSAVIRAMRLDPVFFGVQHTLLVLDLLNDSETLKDPSIFKEFFGGIPTLTGGELAEEITDARRSARTINPTECINLRTRVLQEIGAKATSAPTPPPVPEEKGKKEKGKDKKKSEKNK